MTNPPDDDLDRYRVFHPDTDTGEDEDEDDVLDEPAPALEAVIASLRRGEYPRSILVGLSDLGVRESALLGAVWPDVDVDVKRAVVSELADLAEERFDYTFHRALVTLLGDADAAVRQLAIAGLWGYEDTRFAERLIDILASDVSDDVQAAAARGLAYFVELGEYEEIEEELNDKIFDVLMAVLANADAPMHLRGKALESASVRSGRSEINAWIEHLYDEEESGYRATAIYAMGRTCNKRWLPRVLNETSSDDAEVRFEAARAAGRIGESDALPVLADLATDEDAEVRHAAINAMGEIGGTAASRYLTRLAQSAPESDIELIEDAMVEATLMADPLLLDDDT